MKKILFALFLAAAVKTYSIDIKAEVYGGFNILEASTNFDRPVVLFGLNSGNVKIEAEAEIDNFGGMFRLGYDFKEELFGELDLWWKQSKYLSLYITYNEDGHFALDNIAGRNYYGFPGDVLALNGCAYSHAFYDGFKRGVFVNFNPTEAFKIYLGMYLFNSDIPEFMLKSTTLQLVYDLGSNGRLGFTCEGGYMTEESLDDNPVFSLYYNFGNIKNLDMDFGLSYRIRERRDTDDITVTRYHPVNFGVGAVYNGEKINVKSGFHLGFLGYDIIETPTDKVETKRAFDIALDILPYRTFNKNIIGYLNAGFGFSSPEDGGSDFFWRINPYVVIGDENTAAFYAGLDFNKPAFYPNELHIIAAAGLSIKF